MTSNKLTPGQKHAIKWAEETLRRPFWKHAGYEFALFFVVLAGVNAIMEYTRNGESATREEISVFIVVWLAGSFFIVLCNRLIIRWSARKTIRKYKRIDRD